MGAEERLLSSFRERLNSRDGVLSWDAATMIVVSTASARLGDCCTWYCGTSLGPEAACC